jgi:hypothetical protein
VGSTGKEKDIHFLADLKETEKQEGHKGGSGNRKIMETCYDLEEMAGGIVVVVVRRIK